MCHSTSVRLAPASCLQSEAATWASGGGEGEASVQGWAGVAAGVDAGGCVEVGGAARLARSVGGVKLWPPSGCYHKQRTSDDEALSGVG